LSLSFPTLLNRSNRFLGVFRTYPKCRASASSSIPSFALFGCVGGNLQPGGGRHLSNPKNEAVA
jgi:hypothetical protein